jgi:Fe-S-cluster containining protein
MNETGTLDFFKVQSRAFAETLAKYCGREELIDGLLSQAFSSFDGNVAVQSEGYPALACHKGCSPCCTLRVTATAPEVILIARYIRWTEARTKDVNLAKRVVRADKETRGLTEARRVKLKRPCPFILQGICAIYPVRPLACRGHACYDRQACVEAAAGRIQQIPLSEPHRLVRSLVQNAMQFALRDAGYPWSLYELNQAVSIALTEETCSTLWALGQDVFAPARIEDVSPEEMAQVFDRIKESLGNTSSFG